MTFSALTERSPGRRRRARAADPRRDTSANALFDSVRCGSSAISGRPSYLHGVIGILEIEDRHTDARVASRLRTFCRFDLAENRTTSPSRRIQTIDVCGEPSGLRVATEAKFLPSNRLRTLSLSRSVIARFVAGRDVADPSVRRVSGSVAAWDLSGSQRLGKTFQWGTPDKGCATTPCFVVDPQSTVMAIAEGGGTVGLVDLRTRRLARTLAARNGDFDHVFTRRSYARRRD